MEFKYQEVYKYPTCVCLNITDSCNLACRYCFVQQKPHFMTIELAKQAVDWVVNNLQIKNKIPNKSKQEFVSINFFGGEPMLLYDEIIVPLVLYTEEKYKDLVHFGITTNGTLLNKERIDFFKEHNFTLLLSIDGMKETQDFNRPQRNGEGSFNLVEKNIPYLLEKFPYTTFRATLYQPTVKYLYDNYRYARSMGFKNIFLCPNSREKWTEENIKILKDQLSCIFVDRIAYFTQGYEPIHWSLLDNIFKDILLHDLQVYNKDFDQINTNRKVERCGLGTGACSISYCGDIFGCQEQDSRDTNDYFYIGNIFEGVNIQKHSKLLSDYNKKATLKCEKSELCDNCLMRLTCIDDMCPSVSHDLYNTFFIRPEIDCIFYQILMQNAIFMMKFLVENEHNETFKKYLDRIYAKYNKGGEV